MLRSFQEILLINQNNALCSIGKKECLKGEISKDKAYLLGGKQKYRHRKIQTKLETSKTYAEYKQQKLNEKGKHDEKRLRQAC